MSETPEPILVYRRIASNNRATRLLLASFPVALLPLVAASTVVLARMTRAGLLGALIVSALLFVIVIACFIEWFGSDMVLRIARARRLRPDEEPELVRTVENLCIGTGLPVPAIYLIESQAPNAMATGSDPEHASLTVTRGLVTLLNPRELEGVIAHELSHIGNQDTRLSTMLVVLVGVACCPIRACAESVRLGWSASGGTYSGRHTAFWVIAALILVMCGCQSSSVGVLTLLSAQQFLPPSASPAWMALSVAAGPLYVLFLSPLVALLIRQGVSNEREFLADADAVRLTRDPEGLALALVKVGAAQPNPLVVGEGCAHLYFVDPRNKEPSLVNAFFPSHPPVIERIHLLARMGSVELSALRAALDAGESRRLQLENVNADRPSELEDAPDSRFVIGER
jgi:heat shock protein HtpX